MIGRSAHLGGGFGGNNVAVSQVADVVNHKAQLGGRQIAHFLRQIGHHDVCDDGVLK